MGDMQKTSHDYVAGFLLLIFLGFKVTYQVGYTAPAPFPRELSCLLE